MSARTSFADLTVLDRGEPISGDNFGLQSRNPVIIDQLLEVGCISHRHDGHAALANPTADPEVDVVTSGGFLPSDTSLYVGYTLIDQDGGETVLNTTPFQVSTEAGLETPTDGPICEPDNDAGSLLADNYYYGVTITDGTGGETQLSPTTLAVVPPGFANSEVVISGLTDLVTESGGTGWRLWRMKGFGQWALLDAGSTDGYTDDGTHCLDCSQSPPSSATLTNADNKLQITVPDVQPADAVQFALYVSVDGDFTSPCLLGVFPIADAGSVKELLSLEDLADGEPPQISHALPGANKIDPDTDILDWTWKRPVADAAALPTDDNLDGDARVTLDDHHIHIWDDDAEIWLDIGSAPTLTWKDAVADFASLPGSGNGDGDVRATLDDHLLNIWDDGDSAWVTLGADQLSWRSPVANSAALPPTGNVHGDVRMTLDDHTLHAWNGSSWISIGGGGGGGIAGIIVGDGTTSVTDATDIEFSATGIATVTVTDLGGGIAGVEIGAVGAGATIDVSDGTDTVAAGEIDFVAGSGVTVDVSDLGGGTAQVEIAATGGGGGAPDVTDGVTTVTGATQLDFTSAGDGVSLEVSDLGGGVAQIEVNVPANPQVGDGTTDVVNVGQIQLVAAGGASVEVTDLGGGIAQVEITAPALNNPDVGDGVTTITDASQIFISGSGGTTVEATDLGGGIASIVVSSVAADNPDVGDGITTVTNATQILVSGSGGSAVEVTDLGGGIASIVVTSTAPNNPEVSDGVTTVTDVTQIIVSGSGGSDVDVSDLGGGIASVVVTSTAPNNPEVTDGITTVTDVTQILLQASGSAAVVVTDLGSGVASIDVTAAAAPDVTDGVTTVTEASDLSFTTLGGARVNVTNPSGDVAQVEIGAPPQMLWKPSGAVAVNLRRDCIMSATVACGASGTMRVMGGMWVAKGTVISSISLMTGTTAGATLTHSFAALYDTSLNLLATTVDDTTAAWTASTIRTFALATALRGSTPGGTWTAPADMEIYVGFVVIGTTMPTFSGNNSLAVVNSIAPRMYAASTTGITGLAGIPDPAAALGAGQLGIPYVYCS